MNWLALGDLTLHSGRRSSFKIECDHLTDDEVAAGCALLAKVLPPFRAVSGVPRGGLRLEEAMSGHASVDGVGWNTLPRLIIDDVWTTGGSVREFMGQFPGETCIVAVLFARGPSPANVTALFTLDDRLWSQ